MLRLVPLSGGEPLQIPEGGGDVAVQSAGFGAPHGRLRFELASTSQTELHVQNTGGAGCAIVTPEAMATGATQLRCSGTFCTPPHKEIASGPSLCLVHAAAMLPTGTALRSQFAAAMSSDASELAARSLLSFLFVPGKHALTSRPSTFRCNAGRPLTVLAEGARATLRVGDVLRVGPSASEISLALCSPGPTFVRESCEVTRRASASPSSRHVAHCSSCTLLFLRPPCPPTASDSPSYPRSKLQLQCSPAFPRLPARRSSSAGSRSARSTNSSRGSTSRSAASASARRALAPRAPQPSQPAHPAASPLSPFSSRGAKKHSPSSSPQSPPLLLLFRPFRVSPPPPPVPPAASSPSASCQRSTPPDSPSTARHAPPAHHPSARSFACSVPPTILNPTQPRPPCTQDGTRRVLRGFGAESNLRPGERLTLIARRNGRQEADMLTYRLVGPEAAPPTHEPTHLPAHTPTWNPECSAAQHGRRRAHARITRSRLSPLAGLAKR